MPGAAALAPQWNPEWFSTGYTTRLKSLNQLAGLGFDGQFTWVQQRRAALFLLFGLAACVLLIACANAANLFLSQALSRTREFAIRAAAGAGRLRLCRQLLTESVLVSAFAGLLGLTFAGWLVGLAAAAVPPEFGRGWKWQLKKGPLRPREKGPPVGSVSTSTLLRHSETAHPAPPAGNPPSPTPIPSRRFRCSASTTFAVGRSVFLPVPLVVDRESTTAIRERSRRNGGTTSAESRVGHAATCSVAGRVRPAVHPGPEHAAARGVLRPRGSASPLVCLEQHGRPPPLVGRHRLHQVPAHA